MPFLFSSLVTHPEACFLGVPPQKIGFLRIHNLWLTGNFWEFVPLKVTMENVMKTAFRAENGPVHMKYPESVLRGGKRFVFLWKGTRPASTPQGTPSEKVALKRPWHARC